MKTLLKVLIGLLILFVVAVGAGYDPDLGPRSINAGAQRPLGAAAFEVFGSART